MTPRAPVQQVLQGERVECRGQEAGRAADVYACGVHLYKMLFQRYPFEGTDAASMSLNIMSGNIVKPSFLVHPDIDSLLTRMLDANWQTRISVEEIMRHPAYLENLPSEVAVRPLNLTTRLRLCGGAAGWVSGCVRVAGREDERGALCRTAAGRCRASAGACRARRRLASSSRRRCRARRRRRRPRPRPRALALRSPRRRLNGRWRRQCRAELSLPWVFLCRV